MSLLVKLLWATNILKHKCDNKQPIFFSNARGHVCVCVFLDYYFHTDTAELVALNSSFNEVKMEVLELQK